jgi:hypothetical protein
MNWVIIVSYLVFLSSSAYTLFSSKEVKFYQMLIIFASGGASIYSTLTFKM